jgi:hypothetical protein
MVGHDVDGSERRMAEQRMRSLTADERGLAEPEPGDGDSVGVRVGDAVIAPAEDVPGDAY